jgi:hypothetical protein
LPAAEHEDFMRVTMAVEVSRALVRRRYTVAPQEELAAVQKTLR